MDIPAFRLDNGLYWLKAENGAGKYDLFLFFNTGLAFTRQLPVSVYRFYLQLLLTCVVIMLPEYLLVWCYKNSLQDISFIDFAVYSLGLLLLLYNIQWDRNSNFSHFIRISAFILTGMLFQTAYKIFTLTGILCSLLGFFLFSSNYYSYEYQPEGTEIRKK